MAVQNLVSATISSDTKADILKTLADVRVKLGFLLNLQTNDLVSLVKAGKEFGSFLDGCHSVAAAHPEILPGVFDKAEFERDYRLSQDLAEIADTVAELHEALAHTLTAVRSDTLVAALDVYGAVKASQAKVPGLNTVADNLARYFVRTPRSAVASAK